MHTSAPQPQQPEKYRHAGAGREVCTSTIEAEAKAAALANRSLVDSCPYPFTTEAGKHFTAIWFLNTQTVEASINPRPPAEIAQP